MGNGSKGVAMASIGGFRKPKKMSASDAIKKAEDLELKLSWYRLELRERTAVFVRKCYVYEKLFHAAIREAGTIGEATRWYELWCADINAIPDDHPNHEAEVLKVIERHGFEFVLPDTGEVVDNAWEDSRDA